jgi:hypothetical protein
MLNPMCRLRTGDSVEVFTFMKQWTDLESESGLFLQFTLGRIAIFLFGFEFSACRRPECGFVLILVTKKEQPTLWVENDQASGTSQL